MLDSDCMTVTGKTLSENHAGVWACPTGQTIIRPFDDPLLRSGHLAVLHGSLAPEGAVGKISGKEGFSFRGPVKVFDSVREALEQSSQAPSWRAMSS